MLNPSELKAWYCRLNLNEPAQKLINHIRSSDPARRVVADAQSRLANQDP